MNARADHATTHRTAFADRLRVLLVQKGHTLVPAELANSFVHQMGYYIGVQTWGNWINAMQIPQPVNLQALAAFLSVTPEYLLEGAPVLQFAPAKHGDVDVQQLVDDFLKLNAYGRRVAKALMSSLARLEGGAA